jgi:serine/threonine protein kinase
VNRQPSTVNLLRPLHIGPVSEVWLARWRGREVAARRYLGQRTGMPWPDPPDPSVLRLLNHPAVCRFLGLARDRDGDPWYALELLRGRHLGQLVREAGPSPDLAVECVARLAPGLRWLHERSLAAPRIHGDVSPGNVFTCDDGGMKLLDLLALPPGVHPVRPDVVFGTLPYLAPEVLGGAPPDERADVYSLAAVALRAALGVLPWDGASSPMEARAALDASPPAALAARAGTPPWMTEVLIRMLARSPERRPTAGEVCATVSARRSPDPPPHRTDPRGEAGG